MMADIPYELPFTEPHVNYQWGYAGIFIFVTRTNALVALKENCLAPTLTQEYYLQEWYPPSTQPHFIFFQMPLLHFIYTFHFTLLRMCQMELSQYPVFKEINTLFFSFKTFF